MPGERASIVLQLFPQKVSVNTQYKSTLYITLGNETEKREITMFFEANPKALYIGQNANTNESIGTSALAVLGNGNAGDFWINFVLIVIAAILLIAFIARMNRRM